MFQTPSLVVLATLAAATPAQEPQQHEPWIFKVQRGDGSWSASAVPKGVEAFSPGSATDDVVVTSLVTLSCLGAGDTPSVGPHHESVGRALDWLLEEQADDGRLAATTSPTFLADHAIATLALSEAAYLDGGSRYRLAAKAAVSYLERTPLEGGGWSATGAADGAIDFRSTSWATLALASARDAEIGERPELIAAAAWRLRQEGTRIEDRPPREVAFELLTRLIAGENTSASSEFKERATKLLALPIAWTEDGKGFDPERVYVQSIVAYQSGGELWKRWQKTMKKTSVDMGKRETQRLIVDADLPGGSLAGYAYSALTLEIYFRYARVIGAR